MLSLVVRQRPGAPPKGPGERCLNVAVAGSVVLYDRQREV